MTFHSFIEEEKWRSVDLYAHKRQQSLHFYAPTVAAQQVLFIGVKQFSAQKITRYSFVLQHNGAPFTGVHGASVAFVTGVFINHHNFTGVGYETSLPPSFRTHSLTFRCKGVIRNSQIWQIPNDCNNKLSNQNIYCNDSNVETLPLVNLHMYVAVLI